MLYTFQQGKFEDVLFDGDLGRIGTLNKGATGSLEKDASGGKV